LAAGQYGLINAPEPTFSDAVFFAEIIGGLGEVAECELPLPFPYDLLRFLMLFKTLDLFLFVKKIFSPPT